MFTSQRKGKIKAPWCFVESANNPNERELTSLLPATYVSNTSHYCWPLPLCLDITLHTSCLTNSVLSAWCIIAPPPPRLSGINPWPSQQGNDHAVTFWCNQQMARLTVFASPDKSGSSFSAALENACEIRLSSSFLLSPRQPHPFCHKKNKSIKAAFTCVAWN